jgi:hypothetical protein
MRSRRGKYRHPVPARGCRFAAPRGAPALTERLHAEIRRSRPCLRQGCPWYSKEGELELNKGGAALTDLAIGPFFCRTGAGAIYALPFSNSALRPAVHSLRGYRDPETQALPPPRMPLVFQGCAWARYRNPPAVQRCALGMAGAPCFK